MRIKELPLTQGHVAIVDEIDFAWASAFKWVYAGNGRGTHYAGRWVYKNGKRAQVRLHREIVERMIRKPLGKAEIDHINRDGLDNRRANLRVTTRSENLKNRRAYTPSGITGVYWVPHCRKWEAALTRNKRKVSFGLFPTKEEAGAEVARQRRG